MAPRCQALNVSDEKQCRDEATNLNGLFCGFHARTAYAMYRGYKRRNAQLDAMNASPPPYLSNSKTALRNETFASVEDEATLNELHSFLFQKYALIDRCIRARTTHHSRFYSLNMDYGHQAYLDKLINERVVVYGALERLEKRTAEMLYKQAKWFKWVRQSQTDEEATREKESVRVKKENAMFKRHLKIVEARLKQQKAREEARRQEAYLDQLYQDRMAEVDGVDDQDDSDEGWDPIEDIVAGERESFVDMMKRLLWISGGLDEPQDVLSEQEPMPPYSKPDSPPPSLSSSSKGKENIDPVSRTQASPASRKVETSANSTTALTKTQRKRLNAKARAEEAKKDDELLVATVKQKARDAKKEEVIDPYATPKIECNETRQQMKERLVKGEDYRANGPRIPGTTHVTTAPSSRLPGMPADEVDKILEEVAQIKELLFCRILLSHAAVLPAALKANSIEEFLHDAEVTREDLRDLCLRLEQPQLQEIRDACADLIRGEADEDDEPESEDDDDQAEYDKTVDTAKPRQGKMMLFGRGEETTPKWRSKHEEAVEKRAQSKFATVPDQTGEIRNFIDFGDVQDGKFVNKRIRVRVCGRTIWNYPSDKAMARAGWLQYSIIAKGSRLEDAIVLCRNWQEFLELNALAMLRYFPTPTWASWAGEHTRQQHLQLGFIPYVVYSGAERMTRHEQTGARGRGPRQHNHSEYKNVLCGYIKRNDAVSRRLVQYLVLQSRRVCVLVRDAKTGRILVKPPDEHLWITRRKSGMGRASKNEWIEDLKVGENMFELLSEKKTTTWQFGFNEYYDVVIWDLQPGQPITELYDTVHDMLVKARRICMWQDFYTPLAPVLQTLHNDKVAGRIRDAQHGEITIFDEIITGGEYKCYFGDSHDGDPAGSLDFFYNDVDADEDAIILPGGSTAINFDSVIMKKLMHSGPSMKRFVLDLDSDQDSDDFEDYDDSHAPRRRRTNVREDEREARENIPPCPNNRNDPDCECASCEWDAEQDDLAYAEHVDELDNVSVHSDDFDEIEPDVSKAEILKRTIFEEFDEWPRNPETDWWAFINRSKSRVFKEQMHAAELDPVARDSWRELKGLIEGAVKRNTSVSINRARYWRLVIETGWHPGEHRRVFRDMEEAFAAVSLFFPEMGVSEGRPLLPNALLDNTEKARKSPYTRRVSCDTDVTDTMWEEIDATLTRPCNVCDKRHRKASPRGWDKIVRPAIAHLFKCDIIGPAYCPYPEGEAVVVTEPDTQETSLYIDYRSWRDEPMIMAADMRDPSLIDILATAQRFASKHANARFALLRIWTHSHFYPNTLGLTKRDDCSFSDCIGRGWTWTFIPKDMPKGDWSIQHNLDLYLARIKRKFGRRFEAKRDMVLVMAEKPSDLPDLLTSIVFQVQTDPWRYEIDWWKSFVNIDMAFMNGLDKKWLE